MREEILIYYSNTPNKAHALKSDFNAVLFGALSLQVDTCAYKHFMMSYAAEKYFVLGFMRSIHRTVMHCTEEL